MVDGPGSNPPIGSFGDTLHVRVCPSTSEPHFESKSVTVLAHFAKSHRSEQFDCRFIALLAQRDGMEPTQRVFLRDGGSFPPTPRSVADMSDQFNFHAVWLGKRQYVLAKAGARPFRRDT